MSRVTKNCLNCDKPFETNWYDERSKYCSRPCLSIHKKLLRRIKNKELRKQKTIERNTAKRAAFLEKKKRDRVWELKKITEANKTVSFMKNGDMTHKFGENIVTLKNYKEPLKMIPKEEGIGWFGVLAAEVKTGKVQCHLCGQFFDALAMHVLSAHKMKIMEYREKFGLAYTTALVSENERMRLKQSTLDWLKKMSPEEKEEFLQRQKAHLKAGRPQSYHVRKKTIEGMNKDGSCPDQTLQAIIDVKNELGHTPSKAEFIQHKQSQRYVHLVYKHFGSWKKAVEMCKFEEERMRVPATTKKKYTDEELLEYLSIYAQEYQKIPTASDWKRDLFPSYRTYISHFGTIEEARIQAGVYDILPKSKTLLTRSKYYRTPAQNV